MRALVHDSTMCSTVLKEMRTDNGPSTADTCVSLGEAHITLDVVNSGERIQLHRSWVQQHSHTMLTAGGTVIVADRCMRGGLVIDVKDEHCG